METINASIADPQTQGKVHTVDSTNQYRDTWVKSGSGWLRKHSDLLKVTMKMDGKPFDVTGALGGRETNGRDEKVRGAHPTPLPKDWERGKHICL